MQCLALLVIWHFVVYHLNNKLFIIIIIIIIIGQSGSGQDRSAVRSVQVMSGQDRSGLLLQV